MTDLSVKIASSLDKKIEALEQRLLDNHTNLEHQLIDRMLSMESALQTKMESGILQVVEEKLMKLNEKPIDLEETQQKIVHIVDQLKNNMNDAGPVVQAVQGVVEGALYGQHTR